MKILLLGTILLFITGLVMPAAAADDPNISGDLRENIHSAMSSHVESNTYDGDYIIYDAVEGKLLELEFKDLHSGIVKKGNFYVSCADFTDDDGTLYDIDFLVVEKQGQLKVIEALVHSVSGKKRQYQVEED
ncbi:MAG: hypothetical protein RIG61_07265 [Deltaproteobacteria bacterium]